MLPPTFETYVLLYDANENVDKGLLNVFFTVLPTWFFVEEIRLIVSHFAVLNVQYTPVCVITTPMMQAIYKNDHSRIRLTVIVSLDSTHIQAHQPLFVQTT